MITDSMRSGAKAFVSIAWIFAASLVLAQTPPAPAPAPSWGAPGTAVSPTAPHLTPTRPTMPSTAGATALPAGTYTLSLLFAGKTTTSPATITRNGSQISMQLPGNIVMSGAVDVGGGVTFTGPTGLQLSGSASNNKASGSATWSTATPPTTGTFTLGQGNWNVVPNKSF